MHLSPLACDPVLCRELPARRPDNVYQRHIVLYARVRSLRCWRAKRFLGRSGYRFEVVDVTEDPGVLAKLSEASHHEVVAPYVFVDRRPVGGMGTVRALVGSGQFEHLLRDDL
jgi:glutaredoxin